MSIKSSSSSVASLFTDEVEIISMLEESRSQSGLEANKVITELTQETVPQETISGLNYPGENYDIRTGQPYLNIVDVTLPGNGGLDIIVSRNWRAIEQLDNVPRGPNGIFTPAFRYFFDMFRNYTRKGRAQSTLGDWDIDIPHLQISEVVNFWGDGSNPEDTRPGICENPVSENLGGSNNGNAIFNFIWGDTVWNGIQLVGFPGESNKELLMGPLSPHLTEQSVAPINAPHLASADYVTTDNWVANCIQDDDGKYNGFLLMSPNGTKYYMDVHTSFIRHYNRPNINIENGVGPSLIYPLGGRTGLWSHPESPVYSKRRIYVSRIEDRNGNWIRYNYDQSKAEPFEELIGANPVTAYSYGLTFPYLSSIQAGSFGNQQVERQVQFEYTRNPWYFYDQNDPNRVGTPYEAIEQNMINTSLEGKPAMQATTAKYRLSTMIADGRRWNYFYDDANPLSTSRGRLVRVERPDYAASTGIGLWEYSWVALGNRLFKQYTIKYPTGGTVRYDLLLSGFSKYIKRGLSGTDYRSYWGDFSILRRRVTYADNSIQDYVFEYQRPFEFPSISATNLVDGKKLDVTRIVTNVVASNNESKTVVFDYRFEAEDKPSNSDSANNGYLYAAITCIRTETNCIQGDYTNTYNDYTVLDGVFRIEKPTWELGRKLGENCVYKNFTAIVPVRCENYRLDSSLIPHRQTSTTERLSTGVFTKNFEDFDIYGNAKTIKNNSQVTRLTFKNVNTSSNGVIDEWMIGMPVTQKLELNINQTEPLGVRWDYYDNGDLMQKTEMGRIHRYNYFSDGELNLYTDPSGGITTYSDYKRGVPQLITYQNGDQVSGIVDNQGRVTSTTDNAGNTTAYGYDELNVINRIDPPLDYQKNKSKKIKVQK